MHIFFPVARRRTGLAGDAGAPQATLDAGQIDIVRDPDDESEWQYLGNPEIAARTSLKDVVARFIVDCGGANGVIDQEHVAAAEKLRAALLSAARRIDDVLGRTSGN